MPTSGKRLLAAFVAGMVAASLLLALPLYTIRERVLDLEEREQATASAANATAGAHLLEAAEGLTAFSEGSPGSLAGGPAHASAARDALALGPEPGPALESLDAANETLSLAADAGACGVLEPRSPAGSALSRLAGALEATGRALVEGDPVDASALEAAADDADRTLEAHLSGLARLETASVETPSERARALATGPLPAEGCPGGWSVEVCLVGAGEQVCTDPSEASGVEREGRHTVSAPVPGTVAQPRGVEVRVETTVAGVESTGQVEVPAERWPFELETLSQGPDSEVNATRSEVVGDEAAFERLWRDHAGDDERPSVDLDTHVVAAAFQGERDHVCNGVRLDGVRLLANGSARVTGTAFELAGVGCPSGAPSPHHVVAVPRVPGDVWVDVAWRIV